MRNAQIQNAIQSYRHLWCPSDQNDPVGEQRRIGSECADAQANNYIRCPHILKTTCLIDAVPVINCKYS